MVVSCPSILEEKLRLFFFWCFFCLSHVSAKHLTCRNQTTVSTPNSGRRLECLTSVVVVGNFRWIFFQVERESCRLSVLAYGPRTRNLGYHMEQKCVKVKGKNRSTENRSDPPLPQMPPHLDPRTTATSTFLSLGHEFEKGTDLLDLLKPARQREAGKKYVNIPSGKYIYVHTYECICVYTYLCKMDERRSYACLS